MSTELKEFLAAVGLNHRFDDFVANGIDMDVIAELTAEDLSELNLNIGERKRLLKAVRTATPSEPETAPVSGPERRQLTVMFVDLVGSTALSTSHDVEDLRSVVGDYQTCCAAIIEKHSGTIAKYMGDGILAYFGYPSAAEHSAEHAARCGLELIREVNRLTPLPNVQLSCRVAAATGMVIVGDLIGSGDSQERQVLGETPNLAGRLQSLANPDQMVISNSTHQLLKGLFECSSLGKHDLKGFGEPLECFTVDAEHEIESRFRATREGRSLSPLRGREKELEALVEQWEACRDGHLESGLLVAEAGIGKSRLIAELVERISPSPHEVIELACHPQFKNSALHPLKSFAERLFDWKRADDAKARFTKLQDYLDRHNMAKDTVTFASTLGLPADGLYEPPTESPQVQRTALARGLARLLAGRAKSAPLLILFEDLHWADTTTLEVLEPLLAGLKDSPVFHVATTRTADGLALAQDPTVTVQHLGGISGDAAIKLTHSLTGGKVLSKELSTHILAQAEGNPLFLEELTKSLMESDSISETDGVIQIDRNSVHSEIPTTLQDSLMARLDRVATAKELAQIGAVVGREFSLDLLSHVCGQPPNIVVAGVSVLEEAELVFPVEDKSEKTWIFKHALIQEAAYDSLLRSRRRELHGLIAQAYETTRPDEVTSQPEVLAHHLGQAGEHDRAIEFGLAAGMAALVRSANADAVAHGRKCLDWVAQLPDDQDRGRLELKIQAILTPALMQSQGYSAPDVEESTSRALKLLELHGDLPEAFPNLWGLNMYHHVRSERKHARDVAERFVGLAERVGDGSQLVAGLPLLGQCSWIEGNLADAEAKLRRGMDLYDVEAHGMHGAMYGLDSHSYSRLTLSQVLWMTGRKTEATAAADDALSHARSLNHTNTIGMSLLYRIMLKQQNGMRDEVAQDAAEALDYCARMGVSTPTSYIAMIANWAQGDVAASQEIYKVHNMIGAQLGMTYYRSLGAENAIDAGDMDTAGEILSVALDQARNTGEGYWLPQLLRLQARIDSDATVARLREASELARASGALMLDALAIVDTLSLGDAEDASILRARLQELIETHKIELPTSAVRVLTKLKTLAADVN
ncbi:AAA family ATPase [Sedimentitalea todarodis]|uniref:Adenylate/guanylate cyclase domain-containing protein n=1 Tax=Sedimentitalea todarodis TaxID=1631240 RepID=A0ABU3V9Q5_9RHOB|nr:adenylate/guanylate cyclase domain-containing protein [Sedimentitalea todarodis]MDU9002901.1 adenylate/guanylate cyclase domain-containing protein [Sedimentitalea todarodis]